MEQGRQKKVLIAFSGEPDCADLTITLAGGRTPAFRMLLPEFVTAANMTEAVDAEDLKPFRKAFLHTVAGHWHVEEDGAWVGVQTHPGIVEITTRVVPHSTDVELTVTLRSLAEKPLNDLRGDYCLGINGGGGNWANHGFLPESKLDRTEDGTYWHRNVAQKGAFVHTGGKWIRLFNRQGEPGPAEAGIIAMNNEAGTAAAFMMWKAPVPTPWINDASACMHLRPQFSPSLRPGESATLRGRMGVTGGGLDDVWRLYQHLP